MSYDSPLFWDLVHQAEKDSVQSNKPLLLVLKQDHRKILAVITEDLDLPNIRLKNKGNTYYMYYLEDLLELDDGFWLVDEPL